MKAHAKAHAGITYSIVTVTPKQAALWLEKNTNNRNVRRDQLAMLTDAISNGHWMFEGTPIRLAADGTVLDGQHRLMACVAAGKPIESMVISGLPVEAQLVIDTGASRTVGDVLSIRGEMNAATIAAVAKRLHEYESTGSMFSVNRKMSPTDTIKVINEHLELREIVRAKCKWSTNVRGIIPISTLITCYYIFARDSGEELAESFMEQLIGRETCDPKSPAGVTRERLLRSALGTTGRLTQYEKTAYIFKGFIAERDGKPLQILRVRKGESFPKL